MRNDSVFPFHTHIYYNTAIPASRQRDIGSSILYDLAYYETSCFIQAVAIGATSW